MEILVFGLALSIIAYMVKLVIFLIFKDVNKKSSEIQSS